MDATGCNRETVRCYEGAGLMPKPDRGPNGYRLYGEKDVRRLGFVLRARKLGLTIEDVRGLLALVDGDRVTCAQLRKATERHSDAIRARIADLQRLERTLADVASQCSGEAVPDCPVSDTLIDGEAVR